MKIGLMSDSHGVFDDCFKDFFKDVDELWHAGDIGGDDAFCDSVAAFKPLVAVSGNCDGQYVRLAYPPQQVFEREGLKILMTHIGGSPGHYDLRARALIGRHRPGLFVCGHSHILKVAPDNEHSLLYVNPGACGIQGWHVVRTALRFEIIDGKVQNMEVFEVKR